MGRSSFVPAVEVTITAHNNVILGGEAGPALSWSSAGGGALVAGPVPASAPPLQAGPRSHRARWFPPPPPSLPRASVLKLDSPDSNFKGKEGLRIRGGRKRASIIFMWRFKGGGSWAAWGQRLAAGLMENPDLIINA